MGYKILLFDLDDTLLDFEANETNSLNKLFQLNGYTFSDELFRIYDSVNKRLWADYETGDLKLAEVLNTRFSKTMNQLGEAVDGIEWEKQYRELLGNGHEFMDGALELCQSLSKSHRLFIVTNGVTKTQIKRLRLSGLDKFFEDVFTSEVIGYQKPSKGFFNYIKDNIKDFRAEDSLIIGDSLNTDIKGGIMAGIDTCWLNTKAKKHSPEIQSTYTITRLEELYSICAPVK